MTKRPLVETRTMSEFGDVDLSDLATEHDAPDGTYTPGWSELRHERDRQMGEVARGERERQDVRPLPVNLRLVRRTKIGSQEPDGIRQVLADQKGYKPVTKDMIGQEWMTKMPPGAHVLPDGTIAKGDCVYMVADAKTAARNQVKNRMDIDRQFDGLDAWADTADKAGADPTTTRTKGAPVTIKT